MIDFGRIFAAAFVRKLAYVAAALLCATVLSLCGTGTAQAQQTVPSGTCGPMPDGFNAQGGIHCSQTAAFDACTIAKNNRIAAGYTGIECTYQAPGGANTTAYPRYYCARANGTAACSPSSFYWINQCPAGKVWHADIQQCADDCSVNEHYDDTFQPPNGSLACGGGSCEVVYLWNADGTVSSDRTGQTCKPLTTECPSGYYYIGGLNVCAPENPTECPEGTSNVDGQCKPRQQCPTGMHESPTGACVPDNDTCPAGKTKAPDGSCVDNNCPSGQTRGSDGTCKKSEDPDKDEGDDDKYFSGGDSCAAPPACSGDPIMCGQARIQWRIDCNTRRNTNIAGGSCNAPPICTGEKCDAMEYSQLLTQWRTACAVEKLANEGLGDDEEGQPEWTKVGGMSQDQGAGETEADRKMVTTKEIGAEDIDTGGWLGGGGCPAIMAAGASSGLLSGFAQAINSPPSYFCDYIGAIAAITLLGAAAWCAVALARG